LLFFFGILVNVSSVLLNSTCSSRSLSRRQKKNEWLGGTFQKISIIVTICLEECFCNPLTFYLYYSHVDMHWCLPCVLRCTGRVPLMLLAGLSSPSLDSCSIEVEKAKVLNTSHSRLHPPPIVPKCTSILCYSVHLGLF
jgi:hypothetical protein